MLPKSKAILDFQFKFNEGKEGKITGVRIGTLGHTGSIISIAGLQIEPMGSRSYGISVEMGSRP